MEKALMKLNLGCGDKIWPGFVNVDTEGGWQRAKPDVVCDLRSLPFEDGSCDEAHAIHVIEHFYQWEAPKVLKEWRRVLKPGGLLVLELPCLDKVFAYIAQKLRNDEMIDMRMSMWALWGDPGWESVAMTHKWGYTIGMMSDLLRKVGFSEVKSAKPHFHVPSRDMRIEAVA